MSGGNSEAAREEHETKRLREVAWALGKALEDIHGLGYYPWELDVVNEELGRKRFGYEVRKIEAEPCEVKAKPDSACEERRCEARYRVADGQQCELRFGHPARYHYAAGVGGWYRSTECP